MKSQQISARATRLSLVTCTVSNGGPPAAVQRAVLTLNGRWHVAALLVYMVVVAGHFAEHLIQLYQVYVLGWHPRLAGGVLGLWYPRLAQNEVLHIAYNSLQLTGLLLLCIGFQRFKWARRWWTVALVCQSWHFFEHVLLQLQYLSGHYLFGASHQKSLLEFVFPRVELHFTYNLLAFTATVIAIVCYLLAHRRTALASVSSGARAV